MYSKRSKTSNASLRITIISVGKWRRDPNQDLFNTYTKRLSWEVRLLEIQEGAKLQVSQRKNQEGIKLISALPDKAKVVVLDQSGKAFTSVEFADNLRNWRDIGDRELAFIIGGADGLDRNVLEKANLILSLSSMTWPHMLVRAMLAEQLWRAASIINNHPYHRL